MTNPGNKNLGIGVKVDIGAVKAELEQLKSIIQSTAKGLSVSLTQVSRDQVNAASQASREMVAIQKAMISQALQVNKSLTASGGFNWMTGGMSPTDRSQMKGFYQEQSREIKNIANSHREAAEAAAYHNMNLRGIVTTGLRVYASYFMIKTVLESVVGSFFNYLSTIETASLGMSAAFMTGGQYIDKTTGKALKGEEALRAAQEDVKSVIKELQVANFETIATLDQLIVAYQTTLPVALHKGFDKRQVMDFTLAMIQAAGSIGLPFEQMAEETRSLLMGTITPRNTRIAVILGITNADIRKYEGDTQGLFNFLMEKLSAFRVAGIEAQYTWKGLWSNMKDITLMVGGKALQPVFDAIKQSLMDIQRGVMDVDEATGKVRGFKPEFLESLRSVKDFFVNIIADVIRFNMFLDKTGGSLTAIGNILSLGMSSQMKEWNKMFEARYKANDKALMDMAMREMGFKPATQEQLLPLDWATPQAAGLTAVKTELGQVLYYTKELKKENADYKANPPPPPEDKYGGMHRSAAKELANALLGIEKSYLGLYISQIENTYRLGLVEDENYKNAKIQYAKDAEENSLKVLKVERDSIIANYESDLTQARGDTEKKAAINAKKEADLEKVNQKEIELKNNTLKTIDDAEEQYEMRRRERVDRRYKFESQMLEINAKELITRALWVIEEQSKQAQFMYEKFQISPTSFYQQEIANANVVAEEKKQLAKVEFDKWLADQTSRMELAFEGSKLEEQLWQETQVKHQEMLDKGMAAEREASTKVKETYRKMADDIRHIYDTLGVSGVIGKALEDIKNEYTNMGKNITDAMNDTASSMTSAMGDFFDYTSDGWLKLDKLIINICKDVYKALVKSMIIQPLIGGLAGLFSSTGIGVDYETGLSYSVKTGGAITPMQSGGDVYADQPYIVGERRPEVFVPNRNGAILPSIPSQSNLNVKIELTNKSGQQLAAKAGAPRISIQEVIIPVVIDAIDRDVMGLRTMLGR